MKQTRRDIIKEFIIAVVFLNSINTIVDGIFEIFLRKYDDNSLPFNIIGAINILITLLILVLVTRWFIRKLDHIIDKEIEYRLNENNLLFASIAHDLKTPMTSIKGYMQAMNDNKVPQEDQKKIYEVVTQKVNYMNTLLNNILNYSRIMMDKSEPIIQTFDINELIRQVVADHFDLIESSEAELNINLFPSPIEIEASREDLYRIFENLLVNACQHNPKGTTIEISSSLNLDKIQVVIADNGKMIDPDFIDSIYQPFTKEDTARRTNKGSGLGLSIVKCLVEKNHGEINLIVDDQQKTKRFCIYFYQKKHYK